MTDLRIYMRMTEWSAETLPAEFAALVVRKPEPRD